MGRHVFSDPPWAQVFDWVAENELWIMVHPRHNQIPDFEALVAAHPNTKVLLHTAWNEKDIPRLLKTYPNVYFTLDLATLISGCGGGGVVRFLHLIRMLLQLEDA